MAQRRRTRAKKKELEFEYVSSPWATRVVTGIAAVLLGMLLLFTLALIAVVATGVVLAAGLISSWTGVNTTHLLAAFLTLTVGCVLTWNIRRLSAQLEHTRVVAESILETHAVSSQALLRWLAESQEADSARYENDAERATARIHDLHARRGAKTERTT